MKIAFRMDDITPDMDWESFEGYVRIFEKYGICPLLGIVPDNRDPKLSVDPADSAFADKMLALQKRGYCLAMHGCYHMYATGKGGIFPLNSESEFAGRPQSEQRSLLTEGKKRLEKQGIHTDIFMAPGHTLDRRTVKILKELGFRYITDGFGKKPYLQDGMIWLPIAFWRRLCFTEREGITTFVIHANHTDRAQLEGFEKMIAQDRERFVSYSALLAETPVKRNAFMRAGEYVLAFSKGMAGKMIRRIKNR